MNKADNIATQQRFGKAVNNNSLMDIKDLVSPDVVDHDPAPDQGPGPEGFIHFFSGLIAAFPDLAVEVEHMVADDENVSIAYTITGTQRGPFMGVPPSNRRVRARGVQIARFNDEAKMVERWGSSDQLGILQQIGVAV